MINILRFLIILLIISIQSVRAIQTNADFEIQFIYESDNIIIDGLLDEYSSYPSLKLLPNSGNFLTVGTIDDSSDCSAHIWLLCDEDNLYFAGRIKDDSVLNNMTGDGIWNGDAVLFYFGLYDLQTVIAQHTSFLTGEEPDYQIGVSSTGLTYLWRWQIGEAGISIPDCEVFTTQNSDSWTFELKCPLSGLAPWGDSEFEPAIGIVLPINILIDDDDDGGGREAELYWMNDPATEDSHIRPELWGREVVIIDTGSAKPIISEVSLSSNIIYPGDIINISANVFSEDSISFVKCYFKNNNEDILDSVELVLYDINSYENTWTTPLDFVQSMDINITIFAVDTGGNSSQKNNVARLKFYKPVLLLENVNYGESYKVFDNDNIAEIRISIEQDSLDILFAVGNEGSYEYLTADFSYESENIPLTTVSNVGLRLRGAIPRYCKKRDFKISFNKFVSGRNFYGLKKFNLRSLNRDPSIIREKICLDLLKDMNAVSTRASFVKLYINDEYWGLYLNVEQVDGNFLNAHCGNSNGNLYKCARYANLSIREDGDYKFTFGPPEYAPHQIVRAYKLSTNETEDDYTDLINLIDVINNTSYYNFTNDLENSFNVQSFLKAQAVSVIVGDWDGFWSNQNNYYIYHNTNTNRFEFIPRDLDLTLGVDWGGGEYATPDIYNFGPVNDDSPLINRMFSVPEYKGEYSKYIKQLIDNYFLIDQIWPKIEDTKELIQSAAENDTYRTLDYGWDIDDFNNSYTEALGTFHAIDFGTSYDLVTRVPYGLKPFIETRLSAASDQIDTSNVPPEISETSHYPLFPGDSESVIINATVNSYSIISAVKLNYNIGNGFQSVEMFDDGIHNDNDSDDQIYGIVLPPYPTIKKVYYYISAVGSDVDNICVSPENAPYSTYYYANGYTKPSIVINEYMSDNENTIEDEAGEYEDWIELYNFGSETIQLGGMYLTDNLMNPTKWQIPEIEIASGEFLLFWTDDEVEGPLHTNFKLSKSGERIGLFDTDKNGNFPIDFFTYISQNADESYGRSIDGGDEWNIFNNATPGQSNTSTPTNIDEEIINSNTISHLVLYPNYLNSFYPSTTIRFVLQKSAKVELKIFDLMGREIEMLVNGFQTAGVHEMTWQPEGLPSGAYFCILQTGEFSETKKLILQK